MTKDELEQLIKMHGTSIYGFCYYLTGNRDEADDLYQDTLFKAYEIRNRIIISDISGEMRSERNLCLGIATRLYKNSYRRQFRRKETSLDTEEYSSLDTLADENTPDFLHEKKQTRDMVRQAIDKLPLRQRAVIYLFYYADLSITEISKSLKIPEGTVKSRLNGAKRKLKEELGGYMKDERLYNR